MIMYNMSQSMKKSWSTKCDWCLPLWRSFQFSISPLKLRKICMLSTLHRSNWGCHSKSICTPDRNRVDPIEIEGLLIQPTCQFWVLPGNFVFWILSLYLFPYFLSMLSVSFRQIVSTYGIILLTREGEIWWFVVLCYGITSLMMSLS